MKEQMQPVDSNGLPLATCLLSHKCSQRTHDVAARLRTALGGLGVDLLVDPFPIGTEIGARIDTLQIDSLLFLSEPASISSSWCQRELATARERCIPVFGARLEGLLPDDLARRVCLDFGEEERFPPMHQLAALVRALQQRAGLFRQIRDLAAQFPEDRIRTAQRLGTLDEQSLLAEFVDPLARELARLDDFVAQHWIAIAIGRAGTAHAAERLLSLSERKWEHPYVTHGIREALVSIARELVDHPITPSVERRIAELREANIP
jgi:hypothetical protein